MSVPKTPQFIGVLCVDVNDVLNAQACMKVKRRDNVTYYKNSYLICDPILTARSEHSARSRASSPSNSASRGMGGRSPRSKSSPPRERKSPARIADKGEGASNEKGGKDEQSPVTPDSYRALHDVKLSSRIESSKDIKLLHPTSGCNNISSSIRSYTPSLLAVTASPLGSAECVPNNNPSCSPTPINDAAPPQLFVKSLLPSRDDRASSASTCRSHRPTSASSCISKRAERTISCELSKLHRYVAKLNNDAFDDMPPEEDIVPLGVFEGPISAIYARSVAPFSSKENLVLRTMLAGTLSKVGTGLHGSCHSYRALSLPLSLAQNLTSTMQMIWGL
uniref:Uncharacterized protein n=1 Tax=Trypanosoma vivax (strain Y486) TaxID=1055687 RepID=G0U6S6_TRYVY|nr:conserved hypothetical protein [Trypanosoma vivax Y486]